MKRALAALAIALAVHGLLAVALAVYLATVPAPETLATLDLTSVELSFAERDDETSAVVPQPASPEVPPKPETPEMEPPRPPETVKSLPPDPMSSDRFLTPKDEPRPMETPVIKPVQEEKKVEKKDEPKVEKKVEKPSKPKPMAVPAPAVAPRQAKVDAPPRPRRAIRPDYPKGARQRGEQGDVLLEILVTDEGRVETVNIVTSSGFDELDAAAVRAVQAARFAPARSGNRPVSSSARLTLSFKLK